MALAPPSSTTAWFGWTAWQKRMRSCPSQHLRAGLRRERSSWPSSLSHCNGLAAAMYKVTVYGDNQAVLPTPRRNCTTWTVLTSKATCSRLCGIKREKRPSVSRRSSHAAWYTQRFSSASPRSQPRRSRPPRPPGLVRQQNPPWAGLGVAESLQDTVPGRCSRLPGARSAQDRCHLVQVRRRSGGAASGKAKVLGAT